MSLVTEQEFITKSREVFGSKYKYFNYKGSSKNVTIECPIHGVFVKRAYEHYKGKQGCPYCSGTKSNLSIFIEKANKVHEQRYDYSKSIFVNIDTPLTVICTMHGEFQITPRIHLFGLRRAKDKRGVCHGCKDCGELQKQSNAKRFFRGYGGLPLLFFNRIKNGSKRKSRELEFSTTIEYLWNLFIIQNGKCVLSNQDIQIVNSNNNCHTASLDRIDSSKGYIEGNVQWVHKDINKMKMNFDQDYFIKMCKLIANVNK